MVLSVNEGISRLDAFVSERFEDFKPWVDILRGLFGHHLHQQLESPPDRLQQLHELHLLVLEYHSHLSHLSLQEKILKIISDFRYSEPPLSSRQIHLLDQLESAVWHGHATVTRHYEAFAASIRHPS